MYSTVPAVEILRSLKIFYKNKTFLYCERISMNLKLIVVVVVFSFLLSFFLIRFFSFLFFFFFFFFLKISFSLLFLFRSFFLSFLNFFFLSDLLGCRLSSTSTRCFRGFFFFFFYFCFLELGEGWNGS